MFLGGLPMQADEKNRVFATDASPCLQNFYVPLSPRRRKGVPVHVLRGGKSPARGAD